MKKSTIEEQFKAQLSTREFMPSKDSWNRLDAMLTVAEKPKRSFKWMYVAASVLGFIAISTFYFNSNQQEVVLTKDSNARDVTNANLELISKTTSIVNSNESISNTSVPVVKTKRKLIDRTVSINNEGQIVQKEGIKEQEIPIITRSFDDSLERIGDNQKSKIVTASQKPNYINVDALLAAVDSKNKKQNSKPLSTASVTVNSNDLLTQVDGELELSFREKAIKVVNQKIKTATVAISNRNSE